MAEHLTPETRRGKDEKRLIPGLLAFVSNRYVILSVIFCIIGAVILSMTASLQFSAKNQRGVWLCQARV